MRIIILPAFNGDCILVEIQPSHYILIDGGYVDTYEKYLLPTLEEIAARGGELDIVVVTHIDCDHISGIIRMMEDMPIRIKEIWYNGYRHIQSVAVTAAEKETFVHRNISKESQAEKAKTISAKQGCTLSALIARNGIPWNTSAKGYTIMAPMTSPLGDAIIHVLSPNNKNIEALESFWKKRLIKDGLLKKAHSEEFWDDAYVDENINLVKRCNILFFTGGDQLRITSILGGTPINEAIKNLCKSKASIVGTSAGASVMSDTMIIEGKDDESPRKCTLKMSPGLGLVKNIMIDFNIFL